MLDKNALQQLVDSFENKSPPTYVIVSTLFSELKATKRTALQLSLCSKNAQAITARAGVWGKSFTGVTSFIDESAKQMISLANQVGDLAKGMTRDSVNIIFERQMADQLAKLNTENLQKSAILTGLKERTRKMAAVFTDKHNLDINKLKRYLEEIKGCNRTIVSIVSICRIEASRAGPFQDALSTIAENINTAAEELKAQIMTGDRLMALLNSTAETGNSDTAARLPLDKLF
jgi:hypothetical protein